MLSFISLNFNWSQLAISKSPRRNLDKCQANYSNYPTNLGNYLTFILFLFFSTGLFPHWLRSMVVMRGLRCWLPQNLKLFCTSIRWEFLTSWTTGPSRDVLFSNWATVARDPCHSGWNLSRHLDTSARVRSAPDFRLLSHKPWTNVHTGTQSKW